MFENPNEALDKTNLYKGKFFLGKVLGVEDPLKLNRVKVSVPNLYVSEGEGEGIPWAFPLIYAPMGQGEGYGMYGTPPEGSDVLILLQDGSPYYPVYLSVNMYENEDFEDGSWGWKDKEGNKQVVGPGGKYLFETASGYKHTVSETGAFSFESACGFKFAVDEACKLVITAPGGIDLITPLLKLTGNFNVAGNQTITGAFAVLGVAVFTPLVEILGTLLVQGLVDSRGQISNNGVGIGALHYHTTSTGPSGPPLSP